MLYLSQKNDPSGVGDKVFNEITLASLNNEGGVNTLINYFNRLFLKDKLSEVYERYIKSDWYYKETSVKMEDCFRIWKPLQLYKSKRDDISSSCISILNF